jgi:hypothetical protein
MRYLRLSLIAVGTVMTVSCAKADSHAVADTSQRSPRGTERQASSVPSDTDIVRGPGVATDPDDTGSTRSGNHYAPRPLSSPGCRPQGIALCLHDTAMRVWSVNCCMADQRQTDWLVFAAARDSLQVFLASPHDAYLTMSPPNAAGASAEKSHAVDASWLRSRFPTAGSYIFTAGIESDSATAYEFRVAPVITTGASQPIGAAAQLNLSGPKKATIAVAPRSMMPETDTAALRHFAVKSGTYHVLLVRDTLYRACVLPCARQTVFTLKPGQAVTIVP